MEGLFIIGIIVYIIYAMGKSKGKKIGRHEGSQRGYAAGRASTAKEVIMKDKGGCMLFFLLLITFTVLTMNQFA